MRISCNVRMCTVVLTTQHQWGHIKTNKYKHGLIAHKGTKTQLCTKRNSHFKGLNFGTVDAKDVRGDALTTF